MARQSTDHWAQTSTTTRQKLQRHFIKQRRVLPHTDKQQSPKYRNFKRPFRAVWREGGGRASAGLGADRSGSDLRERDFGIAGARRLAVGGHFSPISGSGPSASLRVRCRFVWSCLVSTSALRLRSGQASWPAGCHAATAGGARGAGR